MRLCLPTHAGCISPVTPSQAGVLLFTTVCHTMQNIQWVIMLMGDLIHVKLCIMDWCGTKSSIRQISALKSVTQHNLFFHVFSAVRMATVRPRVHQHTQANNTFSYPVWLYSPVIVLPSGVHLALFLNLQSSNSSAEVWVHDWPVVIFNEAGGQTPQEASCHTSRSCLHQGHWAMTSSLQCSLV